MPTALAVAPSDSGGGTGVQADLKTFAAFEVYGTCAVTAVAAQNTVGISALQPLGADIVTSQIEAVAEDFAIDAVKTGLLPTAAIVEAVGAAIEALELPFVVVDPVMMTRSGLPAIDDLAVAALKAELLPRAYVVTPNIPEAQVLSGVTVTDLDSAREAAIRILALGPSAVVIKGGRLRGDSVVDLLYDGHEFFELSAPRVERGRAQGTGCTFSAAVAAGLARGLALQAAVRGAKDFVEGALRHDLPVGHGEHLLDQFWRQVGR